jgi:hypothetical protein
VFVGDVQGTDYIPKGKPADTLGGFIANFDKTWAIVSSTEKTRVAFGVRASMDAVLWLLVHLAFEAPHSFKSVLAGSHFLDNEQPKPNAKTGYSDDAIANHVFDYLPYGEAYRIEAGKLAITWDVATRSEYQLRAEDFRKALRGMMRNAVLIADEMKNAAFSTCKSLAKELKRDETACCEDLNPKRTEVETRDARACCGVLDPLKCKNGENGEVGENHNEGVEEAHEKAHETARLALNVRMQCEALGVQRLLCAPHLLRNRSALRVQIMYAEAHALAEALDNRASKLLNASEFSPAAVDALGVAHAMRKMVRPRLYA